MSETKIFCEECRADVNYSISKKQMESTIKGEKYSFTGKEAVCMDCGAEIYAAEVNDFNLKALYDVYRKKNNIVSLDLILAIPEKYAIGKRPLSLLLGWGENTLSRYCDGDIPTKQYSEILQRIYDDPSYYSDILERNKGNLKSTTSYEKSKKAVESLPRKEDKETKIDLVIDYLLSQSEDITPLALQKFLYYIQGFHSAFYGTFLFSEDCEAWVHGPVYREIYFKFQKYRYDPIKKGASFDNSIFTLSEKAIFDSVIKNICCYSGKILENFTHLESPWLSTRKGLSATEKSETIIQKEKIATYFSTVKEQYDMINPNDIKNYTEFMFKKIRD